MVTLEKLHKNIEVRKTVNIVFIFSFVAIILTKFYLGIPLAFLFQIVFNHIYELKCPNCKQDLTIIEGKFKEVNFCPFCAEQLQNELVTSSKPRKTKVFRFANNWYSQYSK